MLNSGTHCESSHFLSVLCQLFVAGHAGSVNDVDYRVLRANPHLILDQSQHAVLQRKCGFPVSLVSCLEMWDTKTASLRVFCINCNSAHAQYVVYRTTCSLVTGCLCSGSTRKQKTSRRLQSLCSHQLRAANLDAVVQHGPARCIEHDHSAPTEGHPQFWVILILWVTASQLTWRRQRQKVRERCGLYAVTHHHTLHQHLPLFFTDADTAPMPWCTRWVQ